ncbi:hypothetical protein [Streptomyces sp. yara]|uniref:hypothetical protein n=1 Tax=Streptomyces sp. yara TaxID=3458421 RepID=UPI004040343A
MIVNGPAEVKALLDAAAHGATVLKPARKEFFGEFTAVHRAPDGAVWKLAAASKKDKRLVPGPPRPTGTAVYLGVARPKASRAFHETPGMSVDRDYGDEFIDFTAADGVCRLACCPAKPSPRTPASMTTATATPESSSPTPLPPVTTSTRSSPPPRHGPMAR